MGNNTNLHRAGRNKQDEFYTQLSDIEMELKHYKSHFRDKIIFCNCDDPYESNFFKYFAMNFNVFGLKKLIATCYATSPIAYRQLALDGEDELQAQGPVKRAYKIEITAVDDYNGDGAIDLADVEYLLRNEKNHLSYLQGDGDFRSAECVALLKEADIVVTNPPFSLFREYVAQLIEYDKKFVIIGNKNAITYKEVFSLIREEKMWLGYRNINADMWFVVPQDYACEKVVDGQRVKHIMGCWFTNLDTAKRHEDLLLFKPYTPEEYPQYDNYDAINVDKVADIPCDYDGIMGVPITFLDKFNPEQFEILGITDRQNSSGLRTKKYTIKDSIRYNDLNARSVLKTEAGYKQVYARILIRKKV